MFSLNICIIYVFCRLFKFITLCFRSNLALLDNCKCVSFFHQSLIMMIERRNAGTSERTTGTSFIY